MTIFGDLIKKVVGFLDDIFSSKSIFLFLLIIENRIASPKVSLQLTL
jgi:hypothetical protein